MINIISRETDIFVQNRVIFSFFNFEIFGHIPVKFDMLYTCSFKVSIYTSCYKY